MKTTKSSAAIGTAPELGRAFQKRQSTKFKRLIGTLALWRIIPVPWAEWLTGSGA